MICTPNGVQERVDVSLEEEINFMRSFIVLIILSFGFSSSAYATSPVKPSVDNKKMIDMSGAPYKTIDVIADVDPKIIEGIVNQSAKKAAKNKVILQSLAKKIELDQQASLTEVRPLLQKQGVQALLVLDEKSREESELFLPVLSRTINNEHIGTTVYEKTTTTVSHFTMPTILLKYSIFLYDVSLNKVVWMFDSQFEESPFYLEKHLDRVLARFVKKALSELKKDKML